MGSPIATYSKVLNLGAPYTHNALVGKVIIQEKVDGSQMRWGFDDKHEFHVGSKGREIHAVGQEGMFNLAFTHLTEQAEKLGLTNMGIWWFGEYLQKPKHNCIKYDRVPKNNIVLFDCRYRYPDGGIGWATRGELDEWARLWDIDLIPELWKGDIHKEIDCANPVLTAMDFLKDLAMLTESYLGGSKVEGVVIKNYGQLLELHGTIRHLTTKYVRDEFREKSSKGHRTPRQSIDDYLASFRSENRWHKAIQHLREDGIIKDDVVDIGKIIAEVHRDLLEEEGEAIKKTLFEKYRKMLLTTAVRGFPDAYKDYLYRRLHGEKDCRIKTQKKEENTYENTKESTETKSTDTG